jgi:hypothetical protein
MQERIPQLDGIRGIAILVVMLHNESGKYPFLYLDRLFANGWMGVDLFFFEFGAPATVVSAFGFEYGRAATFVSASDLNLARKLLSKRFTKGYSNVEIGKISGAITNATLRSGAKAYAVV